MIDRIDSNFIRISCNKILFSVETGSVETPLNIVN